MAGPSIAVRVLGDASGLARSIDQAGGRAKANASAMQGAFSTALGALNRAGVLGPFQDALAGVGASLEILKEHAKQIGPAFLAGGAAIAAVGTSLQVLGSKDKAAHQQLQAAVEATGHSYDDYASKVEAAIHHQEAFGHTADQTQDALRVLTQATGDPTKALQYLNEAADLAAAKHEDLATAATQMGKVYNGQGRILKEYGLQLTNTKQAASALTSAQKQAQTADVNVMKSKQRLADVQALLAGKSKLTTAEQLRLRNALLNVQQADVAQKAAHEHLAAAHAAATAAAQGNGKALDQLGAKLKGQASAAADTFSGRLNALKARAVDAISTFGQKWGPALQVAGLAMAGVGATISGVQALLGVFRTSTEAATVATEAMTAAEDAEAVSSWLALGPILLIVAGVAALIAIGYVLYRNWSTIWKGIQAAVSFVWDWIKNNWPLLLAIITGPIGIAVLLIVRNFDTIKGAILAVWDWIKTNWPLLLAILTGPFGLAVLFITRHFDDLVSFFQGLPSRIGSAVAGMWNGILDAFRTVINGVIDLWNRLHFTLPHIDLGPLGTIGGGTIGVPQIPHLAQGGLITRTGLVYAHAGEAITPAPARGPLIAIANAHFTDPVDVDVLFGRVTGLAQGRAV